MKDFSAQIIARVSAEDRDRLEKEAERDGLNISSFMRMVLRRELHARARAREESELAHV